MAMNFVPLDKNKHKDLKVAVDPAFPYAKNTHLAAATIKEFAQLASAMPLVIIQDPKTSNYHVVAMLGMEPGQNLFLQNGNWSSAHVPMNILRYPFDVRPDGDKLGVYLDDNSELLKDDGQALFTAEGEATPFMESRQKLLVDLANSEMMTQKFVAKVVELDLLNTVQLTLQYQDGQGKNVGGIMTINEKKIFELSDEQVLALHKDGFLGAIYALMMSLGQLNRLIELSAKSENPIKTMQMGPAPEAKEDAATAE